MPAPNIGKLNSWGYATQTQVGTYVAPASWLNVRDGDGYLPDYLDRPDNYSHGSIYEAPAQYAGVNYQGRRVTAEATITDVRAFLELMYGSAVAGTLTPALANNAFDFMPMTPFSAQLQVAGDSTKAVRVTDAQGYELNVTIPENREENATMQLAFHAVKAEEISAGVTAPVRPAFARAFARMHASFAYNATTITAGNRWKVEKNQIIFRRPIIALPGDGEFIAGFETDGENPAGIEIQLSVNGLAGSFASIMADAQSKAIRDCVWAVNVGANKVEVGGKFQVKARTTPIAQGRVVCDLTLRTVQTSPTAIPFTIKF